MKRLSLWLIFSLTFLTGCQPQVSEFRVDDLFFGNKRVGLQADEPVFHPGEEFYFNYAIRGAQKDEDGFAKVSLSAQLSNTKKPIEKFDQARYRVNSEITSYGPRKASKARIPKDASGPGTFTLKVTDHVADTELEVTCPYMVEAR